MVLSSKLLIPQFDHIPNKNRRKLLSQSTAKLVNCAGSFDWNMVESRDPSFEENAIDMYYKKYVSENQILQK